MSTKYFFTDRNDSRSYPIIKPWQGRGQEIREIVSDDPYLKGKFGNPVLDSGTVAQLQKMAEDYRNLDFMAWANNQLDLSTPFKVKYWMNKIPEIFEPKLAQIDNEAEEQKKVAMITAFGPQNIDDLRLMYDVQQEQKTLSNLPVFRTNESQTETNKLHSFIDQRPLFPGNYGITNWSNPFGSTTPFQPTNYRDSIATVFGSSPNNNSNSRSNALNFGFSRFI